MRAGPFEILLVEDDPDDVMLMKEALSSRGSAVVLRVVVDGAQALEYLRGRGSHAGAARPSLVLLDWRLPRLSGEEVLGEIRRDPALKLLPVIVLTTSASQADVDLAYGLGANAFLTKPTGGDNLDRLVAALEDFWLRFARLPGR